MLRTYPNSDEAGMDIHPVRADEDDRAALAEIEAYWGALEGSEAGDKLDVPVTLVESHETRRWPIDAPKNFHPVDVLHYAIEELGHTQAAFAELLGSRSRASKILARRRGLTSR
jgi:HTH-type transcriptional regulator/antitoxin HigA